ncbi:class I adenylate-forming enzyme family protein [Flavobacterium sp. N1994]|uniref:class I adenylate-forming enzyme family protein n=1 Tax=Flavobacterium sp. N1994 TaxID=2986827 RepID=UPI002222F2E1|nr:AMP-binding protein [Flavobacterium sp. N1994]
MNLINLFDLSLKGRKDKVAIEFNSKTFTFGDIDCRSNQMANFLVSKELEVGDRICVYLENCVEMIDLFLAAAKTGVIFIPINILYKEREVSHIIADAEPKLVISDGELPGGFDSIKLTDLIAQVSSFTTDFVPVLTNGDTPAALVYTSGTTGLSKGAILTHNNFISNGINLVTCWKITEEDRFLLSLPLFHVHALANGINCWLISGCTMKLLTRFEHQKAENEFMTFQPSLFFGVPTMYIRLLDLPSDSAYKIGQFMRLFVCGSAPLSSQTMTDFKEKFGHDILERYGMTETLMNISNPYIGERRPGTIGFALPGISVKIMLPDGTPAGIDEEGEVYIKGPNVCAGYWKREQATIDSFVDGYFKTGDMGISSVDGYITLKGRKSDLIISGGFNIYPREIEEFLLEQPGIVEVAVIGIPHETRGEMPVAYIVANENYDAKYIEEICKKTFASFKIPRDFILVDHLPRTALGKIQKHLLLKS